MVYGSHEAQTRHVTVATDLMPLVDRVLDFVRAGAAATATDNRVDGEGHVLLQERPALAAQHVRALLEAPDVVAVSGQVRQRGTVDPLG